MPRKLVFSDSDLATAEWRSADGDVMNRVEVARVPGGVAMRDSDRPIGPVLLFTVAEWDDFTAGLMDGEFDLTP